MATDKKRVSTYLADDEVRMLDAIVDLLHLNPQNGRSEAIEAALKFYFAYLSNQMNTDYLCGIYGRQVEAIVQRATDRISSQLFKQAVETNMLTRIVAFEYELSKDEYDKMRSLPRWLRRSSQISRFWQKSAILRWRWRETASSSAVMH